VKGTTLRLRYREQVGQDARHDLTDRSLASFVKRCQDLDEQHLFAWVDEDGEANPVTSSDVNGYIREATGCDFTAKHFRTWAASVAAFERWRWPRRTLA
jgi:DNA topoisomerase-1